MMMMMMMIMMMMMMMMMMIMTLMVMIMVMMMMMMTMIDDNEGRAAGSLLDEPVALLDSTALVAMANNTKARGRWVPP